MEDSRYALYSIHTIGGRAPCRKKDIEEAITEWVSAEEETNPQFIDESITKFIAHFPDPPARGNLSMEDFSNDPLRWGAQDENWSC